MVNADNEITSVQMPPEYGKEEVEVIEISGWTVTLAKPLQNGFNIVIDDKFHIKCLGKWTISHKWSPANYCHKVDAAS